jgi:hypothetical protein
MMALILSIVALKAAGLTAVGWWLFKEGGAFDSRTDREVRP